MKSKRSKKKMYNPTLNSNENTEPDQRSFDVLSGDDTQFEDVSSKRLPQWAKSSAAQLALGQFNLANNRAFQVLANRLKKVP